MFFVIIKIYHLGWTAAFKGTAYKTVLGLVVHILKGALNGRMLSLWPFRNYYNFVFSLENVSIEDLPFNKKTKSGLGFRDN